MIKKICNYLITLSLIISSVILISTPHTSSAESGKKEIVIEDFEFPPERLFKIWLKREHSDSEAATIYSVQQEKKNSFLHSDTKRSLTLSIQLGKIVNETEIYEDDIKYIWDIKKYPCLSWDWRANKLPKKGDESKSDFNDSAAGIYVATQKMKIPFLSWKYQPVNVLKYVWSTSLPEGKVIHRNFKFLGLELYHVAYIVIESGEKKSGKWVTEKRNIVHDYTKAFGEEPEYSPVLIGILSDSNVTLSESSADFDNFIISQE